MFPGGYYGVAGLFTVEVSLGDHNKDYNYKR